MRQGRSTDFPAVAGVSQPVASGCIGDCDDDGFVSIDNVILMINVALGTAPAGACAAGDADANGRIAIDELVAAVHAALVRCPAPTPTRRPTLPPLPALIVPTPGAVLRDVTVINPGVSRHERQTVTILGNTITSVEDRSGEDFSGSEQGHGEFRGRYVLPGLIDMHVHTPDGLLDTQLFMMLYLAHGVTTVRDTGNFTGSIFDYRQMIESGQFPGPRIFACGSILDGPPPVWPNSCVVSDADTAEGCVRTQAAKGASCIKVYNNLSEASLGEIRRAAKTMGLPLIGHIPLAVPLERAGVADVQHLTGVPSVPYSAGAHYWDWFVGAWEQLDDARRDLIVRTSLEQGIAHTPTLTVFDRLSRVLADYDAALDDPAAQLLPRYYRESCSWNARWNPFLAAVSPRHHFRLPGRDRENEGSRPPAPCCRSRDPCRQRCAQPVRGPRRQHARGAAPSSRGRGRQALADVERFVDLPLGVIEPAVRLLDAFLERVDAVVHRAEPVVHALLQIADARVDRLDLAAHRRDLRQELAAQADHFAAQAAHVGAYRRDLSGELAAQAAHLGSQRGGLPGNALQKLAAHGADLAAYSADLGPEAGHLALDALQVGRDDVLNRLLDGLVHAARGHEAEHAPAAPARKVARSAVRAAIQPQRSGNSPARLGEQHSSRGIPSISHNGRQFTGPGQRPGDATPWQNPSPARAQRRFPVLVPGAQEPEARSRTSLTLDRKRRRKE